MLLGLQMTPKQVRDVLDYDPETGELRWRRRTPDMFRDGPQSAEHVCARWNSKFAGKIAGNPHAAGYVALCLFNQQYLAHRVIWAWVTAEWPDLDIDHANASKSDNRWVNLRLATRSQNGANRRAFRTNVVGLKGISFNKEKGKWRAQISVNKKYFHLGYFDDPLKASAAYECAALAHFGEFAAGQRC